MAHRPRPLGTRFWTPGTIVLLVLMAVGWTCVLVRYLGGLGYATHLDDAHPWGLWIAVDVAAGVALAAGGFTTSFLVHVLGRERYEPLLRPALLTAALGYTFVAVGVALDIGRSWAIWKPLFFWNPHSALFEVALCVMTYLTVLYIELYPVAAERFGDRFPLLARLNRFLGSFFWVFILLGVVLSCMHQSSLGTLMLVAPTKVHPLWYTPVLPLLFLLSAFAVGYPMVILETGVATRSLRLESEMEVLGPLSRFTVLTLGLYLAVKVGDMLVRGTYRYLLDGTAQSNAFLVEVLLGALAPWCMLLSSRVRRSRGALFVAACLIVLGVLLNRINVFVVAYEAPYTKTPYFPSVAEIAVTVGMLASLLFLYRTAVTWLPVISAPFLKRGSLCVAAGLFFGNVGQAAAVEPEGWTAPDQAAAVSFAHRSVPFVREVRMESPGARRQRLLELGIGIDALAHTYLYLASPEIRKHEDRYEPVRFSHGVHAASLEDCSLCHHARPADPEAAEIQPCSACHRQPFDASLSDRPGLKGAYHLRCAGCHESRGEGPVTCTGCHLRRVPDHRDRVDLPEKPTPLEVTRQCLGCHEQAGQDVLSSAHWLWRGPSPYTLHHGDENEIGKRYATLNSFCINIRSNEPRCSVCHPGYGFVDDSFDFTDPSRIDCLVCHDTTGTYEKWLGGMPREEVDLVRVARSVGHTSRRTCGACHFSGGGGDAVKHADLSGALERPERRCDVHMGGYDFGCTECHVTRNHRIAGRSSSVAVTEGARRCEGCHTEAPHYGDGLLDHHLNEHCDHLGCNTCHSPLYAKCRPTKVYWDWSQAGNREREPKKGPYGGDDYHWKKGEFGWAQAARPAYAWSNGSWARLLAGDTVKVDGVNRISEPVGSMRDPRARIEPFKRMRGVQPVDLRTRTFLIPHLFGVRGYWTTLDWKQTFTIGMKAAGLPYSGEHGWAPTEMYLAVRHEVMPKEHALSCAHCHKSLSGATSCNRCHEDSRQVDFAGLARKGIDFEAFGARDPETGRPLKQTDVIDFGALGYEGDPIVHGGRFRKLPLRSTRGSGR